MSYIYRKNINKKKFLELKKGEFLIFSPNLFTWQCKKFN